MSKEELKKFIGKAEYDKYGSGYIWGLRDNEMQMLADLQVRGWGAIQNMFDVGEDAEKFQDEIGNFIADAINEKIERESQQPTEGVVQEKAYKIEGSWKTIKREGAVQIAKDFGLLSQRPTEEQIDKAIRGNVSIDGSWMGKPFLTGIHEAVKALQQLNQ